VRLSLFCSLFCLNEAMTCWPDLPLRRLFSRARIYVSLVRDSLSCDVV
jgi:hypothetical protein